MLLKNLVETSLDGGVDRKTLKKLTARFMEVNQARLDRARATLPGKQRLFLDLLPLLLHVNHPMLPGYVSHQTPCGVSDYLPRKLDLLKARRLSRSFTYKREPTVDCRIHSIFLMGSCGTIGQSDHSDIDLWVCYPSELADAQLAELRRKTELISAWAGQLGLETHFFLMDGNKFKQGYREALDGDDCGSTQHFLLLDEFYRTALLLAGHPPIWWLIPEQQESEYDHYADMLRDKRYVRRHETVDFGGIADIPAGEFVGAGIWQLYKGIDSPHKSLLKLILLEAYATTPDTRLSRKLKQMIYAGQLDIDELDPYVLIYRCLEQYLGARSDSKRLELVRQCLYIKAGKRLSSSQDQDSWQYRLMTKLTGEWGWTDEQISDLDHRHHWKIDRITRERKQLVNELLYSYRFLTQFARQHRVSALINSHEMTILGRKLYAAFERRSGKINIINPGTSGKPVEDVLSFCRIQQEEDGEDYWAVYNTRTENNRLPSSPALASGKTLVELIGWCLLNGLVDETTLLDCRETSDGLGNYELTQYAKSLTGLFSRSIHQSRGNANEVFARKAQLTHCALFINIAADPMAAMKEQGLQRLSDHTDSLGFSGLRDNLVMNIERVTVNSWNEVHTSRYEGENAIAQCLQDYLAATPPGGNDALPKLSVYCYCQSRASAITRRIEQLFQDFTACFYSGTRPPESRFIIEIGTAYQLIQVQNDKPVGYLANDLQSLQRCLARPQPGYSPIVPDRFALKDSILPLIAEAGRADSIQVFVQPNLNGAYLFILDENDSLFFSNSQHADQQALLKATHQFLNSVQYRQQLEQSQASNTIGGEANIPETEGGEINYFLVEQQTGSRHPSLQLIQVDNLASGANFFNVQAIAQPGTGREPGFNVYCDQQEFSQLALGNDFYSSIANYLVSRRPSGGTYPCYITDLDLSGLEAGPQTTAHYLHHKHQLERKLNAAIQLMD
jgi:adenylate cyclase class 1